MPEKLPTRTVIKLRHRMARGVLVLLAVYAVVTESQPYGIDYGSTALECELAVRQYGAAVERYKAKTGRLPLSPEQLVPLVMPEHVLCSGDTRGPRPMTTLQIRSFLSGLIHRSPAPERADYSLIERPDGRVTYEILCHRGHETRAGYRGDTGFFTADLSF